MLDRLLLLSVALDRRFPGAADPFKMAARLAEECGELAAEIQHWEGEGVKRERLGDPDPEKTAKEVMDVLTAALAIARHYDLVEALRARLNRAVQVAAAEGLLTTEELAASSPA